MTAEVDIKDTLKIPSSTKINDLCKLVIEKIDRSTFSSDDIFAIHLSMEEACMNAIKHGNHNDPDRYVTLDYSLSPSKLEMTVQDEGDGFDPNKVPDPRTEDNIFKSSGRGLFLMKSYMDIVEFTKNGTCVHMVKYASNFK